jgi:hypothetical protein
MNSIFVLRSTTSCTAVLYLLITILLNIEETIEDMDKNQDGLIDIEGEF